MTGVRKVICLFTINEKETAVVEEFLKREGWTTRAPVVAAGSTTYISFIELEQTYAPPCNEGHSFDDCLIVLVRVRTSGNLPMALAVRDLLLRLDYADDPPTTCAVLFGCAAGIPGHHIKLGDTVLVKHAEWAENGIVETRETSGDVAYDSVAIKLKKMGILAVDAGASFLHAIAKNTGFEQVDALCPDKVIELDRLDLKGPYDATATGSRVSYRGLVQSTEASIIDMESFGFLSAVPHHVRSCVVRVITDMMADHGASVAASQIERLGLNVGKSLKPVLEALADDLTLLEMGKEEKLRQALGELAGQILVAASGGSQPSRDTVLRLCRHFLDESVGAPDIGTVVEATEADQFVHDLRKTLELGYSTSSMGEYVGLAPNDSPTREGWVTLCEMLDPTVPSQSMAYCSQLARSVQRAAQLVSASWTLGVAEVTPREEFGFYCVVFLDEWRDCLHNAPVLVVAPDSPKTSDYPWFGDTQVLRWRGFEDDAALKDGVSWLIHKGAPHRGSSKGEEARTQRMVTLAQKAEAAGRRGR